MYALVQKLTDRKVVSTSRLYCFRDQTVLQRRNTEQQRQQGENEHLKQQEIKRSQPQGDLR